MQYRKQGLERRVQYNQQRIMEQTEALNTLQETFDTSAEKVSNLYKEKLLVRAIYCQPQK